MGKTVCEQNSSSAYRLLNSIYLLITPEFKYKYVFDNTRAKSNFTHIQLSLACLV